MTKVVIRQIVTVNKDTDAIFQDYKRRKVNETCQEEPMKEVGSGLAGEWSCV